MRNNVNKNIINLYSFLIKNGYSVCYFKGKYDCGNEYRTLIWFDKNDIGIIYCCTKQKCFNFFEFGNIVIINFGENKKISCSYNYGLKKRFDIKEVLFIMKTQKDIILDELKTEEDMRTGDCIFKNPKQIIKEYITINNGQLINL